MDPDEIQNRKQDIYATDIYECVEVGAAWLNLRELLGHDEACDVMRAILVHRETVTGQRTSAE